MSSDLHHVEFHKQTQLSFDIVGQCWEDAMPNYMRFYNRGALKHSFTRQRGGIALLLIQVAIF
jgi:hypothetical protein